MKRSATLSLGLLLALSTFAVSANADTTWTEDLKAAQKLSKKEGKPIPADFTGSDW